MAAIAAQCNDLISWKEPKTSGIAFAAGLLFFFFIGALGWSALGTTCLVLALHLAARFLYYNTVGTPPEPPKEWISEAEMQEKITTLTAHATMPNTPSPMRPPTLTTLITHLS